MGENDNSGCYVNLEQLASTHVYWDWADNFSVAGGFGTLARDRSTDTEEWIDQQKAFPGNGRKVTITTNEALQAGHQFAVYAAEVNDIFAVELNDTRMTAGIDASWDITAVTVGTI